MEWRETASSFINAKMLIGLGSYFVPNFLNTLKPDGLTHLISPPWPPTQLVICFCRQWVMIPWHDMASMVR